MDKRDFAESMEYPESCIILWGKYEKNLIGLTKTQAYDLYEAQYAAEVDKEAALKQSCGHSEITLYSGQYTDCGYGMDRHYDTHDMLCNTCNLNFTGRDHIEFGRRVKFVGSPLQLAKYLMDTQYGEPFLEGLQTYTNIRKRTIPAEEFWEYS
ncbi:MAG: hypothetical protein QQN63_00205 [Nitrosopumilus sp.]